MRHDSAHPRVELIAIHTVLGFTLLLCPARRLPLGRGPTPRSLVLAARALGSRHLGEAGLLSVHRDRPPPPWSIAVDGLHGLSMLGVALFSPPSRRGALTSATVAFLLVALATYER